MQEMLDAYPVSREPSAPTATPSDDWEGEKAALTSMLEGAVKQRNDFQALAAQNAAAPCCWTIAEDGKPVLPAFDTEQQAADYCTEWNKADGRDRWTVVPLVAAPVAREPSAPTTKPLSKSDEEWLERMPPTVPPIAASETTGDRCPFCDCCGDPGWLARHLCPEKSQHLAGLESQVRELRSSLASAREEAAKPISDDAMRRVIRAWNGWPDTVCVDDILVHHDSFYQRLRLAIDAARSVPSADAEPTTQENPK
jgi:hypothetical protein